MTEPDQWEAGRPPRRIATLVLLVAGALVAGTLLRGDGVAPSPDNLAVEETPAPSPLPSMTESEAPALLSGEWDRIRVGPLAGRSRATAVWTGSEVMVWGGGGFRPYADGALYDPAADRWRRVAPSPLRPRVHAAGVWNGKEVVILGGTGRRVTARDQAVRDGAAYNPATGRWRTLPPLPFATQAGRVFVEHGRLFAVSKTARAQPLAVLDPGARRWRTPDGPPRWERDGEIAAGRMRGDLLLLWPAAGGDAVGVDLSSERWITVRQTDPPSGSPECICSVGVGALPSGPVAVVAYDPGRRHWWRFDLGSPSTATAQATPDVLYLIDGSSRAVLRRTGQILDLPVTPQGLGRDPAVVWAGDRLFAWGGVRSLRGLFTSDGLTFTPG